MPRNKSSNPNGMPNLPGYYYDVSKNRYFKGTRPEPSPPPPRPPPKHVSLPRLLHCTALGQSVTKSRLHATLLQPANPVIKPIKLPTSKAPQISYNPSDTLACTVSNYRAISVLNFPDALLTAYRYWSEFPPLSLASYGTTVAYATCDAVYLQQTIDRRWFQRKYQIQKMTTVSLSSSHLLMAGQCAKVYPLTDTIALEQANVHMRLQDVLSCELDNTSKFALGTRSGQVVVHDFVDEKGKFYPSGKQRSVASLRIRGDLIWCSTMRGGTNLSAWDIRDLTRPAKVCIGHSNICKMVGMDAAGSLVIAAGDDEKVRVWDIRGGGVLSEIRTKGIAKRVKMVGWASGLEGGCGVWFDIGDEIYARVIAK